MSFFDARRFPLVLAVTPTGHDAESEAAAWYEEWDALFARGPHVVLIDLGPVHAMRIGARQRRAIATHINARRDTIKRLLVAEARLCPSAPIRGLLTAIDWLLADPIGHPVAYFSEREKALDWVESRAAAHGLRIPAIPLTH